MNTDVEGHDGQRNNDHETFEHEGCSFFIYLDSDGVYHISALQSNKDTFDYILDAAAAFAKQRNISFDYSFNEGLIHVANTSGKIQCTSEIPMYSRYIEDHFNPRKKEILDEQVNSWLTSPEVRQRIAPILIALRTVDVSGNFGEDLEANNLQQAFFRAVRAYRDKNIVADSRLKSAIEELTDLALDLEESPDVTYIDGYEVALRYVVREVWKQYQQSMILN